MQTIYSQRLFEMNDGSPISCSLYDYIEISCMHCYDVTVVLDDGSEVSGRAADTRHGSDKTENFVITVEGQSVMVPMHRMKRLVTLTPNASFSAVDFDN